MQAWKLVLWLSTKSVRTLVVEFPIAKVRNGLNAHVTVRSTTVSVRKKAGQLLAVWTASA
jgi:hypothetical protein